MKTGRSVLSTPVTAWSRQASDAPVVVLVALDVVFAEVVADLDLDHFENLIAQIREPMSCAPSDVDVRAVAVPSRAVVDGDGGCAFDNHPMLAAMLMALVAQALARVDDKPLYLGVRIVGEHVETTPRATFGLVGDHR